MWFNPSFITGSNCLLCYLDSMVFDKQGLLLVLFKCFYFSEVIL